MKNRDSLHRTLATIEPPQGLYAAVLARIDLAKRRAAQMRAGLFGFVALVSGALLVPAL